MLSLTIDAFVCSALPWFLMKPSMENKNKITIDLRWYTDISYTTLFGLLDSFGAGSVLERFDSIMQRLLYAQ